MERRKDEIQNVLLMIIDAVMLIASYLLASLLCYSFRGNPSGVGVNDVMASLWLIFLTYFCVYIFFNMNRYLMKRDKYEELVYVVKMSLFVALLLAVVFFVFKQTALLTRGIWAFTVLFNLILTYGGHLLAKSVVKSRLASGERRHMLIVTTSDRIGRIMERVGCSDIASAYELSIALLDVDREGVRYDGIPVTAGKANLYDYARTQIMDEVYLNSPDSTPEELEAMIEGFEQMGIIVHLNIDVLEGKEGFAKEINMLGTAPVVSFAPRFFDDNKLAVKRIIDIIGALVGLAITGVVFIFLAPAIKLESPGPVFFKQKRVGKNGRYFYIYKFRSMCQDAEAKKKSLMTQNEMKGAMFKMTDDPRVTKVGKFIRATSLDELPQFWNILKGDMSLVGTRPPTVGEFKEYEAHHKRRLSMKPGLTGMWQVSGRSNIEDFEEVVRMDCYYIDNWSLQLDAMILLKTVVVVFKKVGSK